MSSVTIALIAFACIFGGALAGLLIQRLLPEHHLQKQSKDAVKMGVALVATMAALVLGLLVSSAKSTYDLTNTELVQMSAKIIMLDRLLAQYGSETDDARHELRKSVSDAIILIWPDQHTGKKGMKAIELLNRGEQIIKNLRHLSPGTENQRSILNQALLLSSDIVLSRWLLIAQYHNAPPPEFLVILIFWVSAINLTYGLFAPRNMTVITVLFFCAVSVSACILLINEMNRPLDGLIQVSSGPMRYALEHIGGKL